VRSTTLGQILVGTNGKTLYLFEADTSAASNCSGACAQAWPPLTTSGGVNAAGGASPSLVGTTARNDGSIQVTYAGHPLYFYIGDRNPGDANGEGSMAFGAGWDVLAPSGAKIEKAGS
jgi:predicted lipoprotein with Yx(FWY)xxD motif